MLIGQTDMFQPETPLGLRGRVGDKGNMCAFHQGQEARRFLHNKAEYKRAVDPSLFMTLQTRRGPYKGRPRRDSLRNL